MKEPRTTPQSILIHTMQEDIPEHEIDLWPGLHQTLVSSQNFKQRGVLSMFSRFTNKPFVLKNQRFVAGVVSIVALIVAVFILLPERQALADAFNYLFRPVDAEQFPTPSAREMAAPTFPPTFAAQLAPVDENEATQTVQPLPTGTPEHNLSVCETDPYGYVCKVAWAEKQAGFDASEFPTDPKGFAFRSVNKTEPGEISIEYGVIGGGGYLYLSQGVGSKFPVFTGEAPEDAIEPVMVGENYGEYVYGHWAIGGIYKEYTWLECCMARLRWVDGNRWFEIYKQAAMPQTDYMTREVMIDMALNLVDQPDPKGNLRLEYLSLEEASQLVDFKIMNPGILPKGFRFGFARYDKDTAQLHLNYYPNGDAASGNAALLIIETPLSNAPAGAQENQEGINAEDVEINGFPGAYFSSDPGNHVLTWRTSELEISVIVSSNAYYGGLFTQEQILEIGESIK